MRQLLTRPDIRPSHEGGKGFFETKVEAPTFIGQTIIETDMNDDKFRDPNYNEFLRSSRKLERRVMTTL
jgi:hypothetical protein